MKKICIITTVSVTLKSFVVDTAKYLNEKCGYDITLICSEDQAFAESLPKEIHYIPVHMDRGMNLSGFSAIYRFIKIFKREKFDLVQYATPNAACYASIASYIAKVPIRLYCQWGIRYAGFSGLKRLIFKRIEKLTCFLSTDIRAASRLNKEFAIAEGLYTSEKVGLVGNGGTIGVNMSVFDISQKENWSKEIRNILNIEPEKFVFGFSGRVTVDKGCEELFCAFRKLSERYENVKLMIVGPEEDDGIDDDLSEWASQCTEIVKTGFVEKKSMQKYYAAMDVLVHPSYREGFGMVLQEAGAMGIPIITTRIPGASEVMEENVSCLLVEPKNSEQLYAEMEYLLLDQDRTKAIGDSAYERAKKMYDSKIRLALQKEDYMKLIEG